MNDFLVADTNIVSYIFKKDTRGDFYKSHFAGKVAVTAAQTLAELELMPPQNGWGKKRRDELRENLKNYTFIEADKESSLKWAPIRFEAKMTGKSVSVGDAVDRGDGDGLSDSARHSQRRRFQKHCGLANHHGKIKFMRYLLFFLFAVFAFAACQKSDTSSQNAAADAERYALKGTVVAVDRQKKKATVKHEEIPGYMEAMTMDFAVKDDWVWDDLLPGADIRAELVVDKDRYWIEKLAISAAPNPNQPPLPPAREDVAQTGVAVPDFALTNQDGKRFNFKDYRGKATAVTFIYSRCPLPEYCILMSRHFSDLANQLHNDADLRDKIRLLSVSFDPATDTPAKLKEYGRGYLGKDSAADFTVWQLATGSDKEVRAVADFFGLRYELDPNDKTQFAHSLRTIVVAPDGKVRKVFAGSDWTTEELLRELKSTL